MSWALVTNATHVVDGWEAEARRLRDQLAAVGTALASEHGPVLWRSVDREVDWSDSESIAAAMVAGQIRDESPEPQIMAGLGSAGSVQGYASEAVRGLVSVQWHVGGSGEWQFHADYSFATGGPDRETARALNEYDPEWLASLLRAAAVAVQADQARITETRLQRALRKARREAAQRLGAVTLVPVSIESVKLPDSVTSYSDARAAIGTVLVADLDTIIEAPGSLVADMLQVDDLLLQEAAQEHE